MIKGVNKQVLEINETQNSYFEKAIFFVKPEYSGMSEGKLRESAKKEVETTCKPPIRKSTFYTNRFKGFLIPLLALGVGIIIGVVASTGF